VFCKHFSLPLLLTALYGLYLKYARKDSNGELLTSKVVRFIDEAFTDHLRWQTHTNLFRNDFLDKVTGRSLFWLMGFEVNKKLMTDLFLMIYR